jgi:hypothetical protein
LPYTISRAGFTSVFFSLSILWQEGLGRSALMTGPVLVPFSFGIPVTAANSDLLSARLALLLVLARPRTIPGRAGAAPGPPGTVAR